MITMHLFEAWRRAVKERPAAARLAWIALACFAVGVGLAVAGIRPLAQLIGGLALVPLSVAIYLCLLPARFWPDGGDDGGGWGGIGDRSGPPPAGGPAGGVDWDSFERQFRTYVEDRQPAGV